MAEENKEGNVVEGLLKAAQEKLASVTRLRENGNELYNQGDSDDALNFYSQAVDTINKKILEPLEPHKEDKTVKPFLNLVNVENTKLRSNLALLYTKKGKLMQSVVNDEAIVNVLDPKFDKSYMRLILNYATLGKIENSVYYYQQLMGRFDAKTLAKYQSSIKDLMAKNEKFNEEVTKLSKAKKRSNLMMYVFAIVVLGLAYFAYNSYFKKPVEEVF